MRVKFTYWKDIIPQGYKFFRNAHLQDLRSWTLWLGKHCFGFEIHGMGPEY